MSKKQCTRPHNWKSQNKRQNSNFLRRPCHSLPWTTQIIVSKIFCATIASTLTVFHCFWAEFEINPDAVEFLNHIKGPLGVVSVAGMYRTGKSYLLNRVLLNRQGGFGVGPSIHPCTKGIHIYGAPISGTTASGEPVNVLVVDSEGLGGLDEDNNHDMRIFSLALLISSYFIYNSMG